MLSSRLQWDDLRRTQQCMNFWSPSHGRRLMLCPRQIVIFLYLVLFSCSILCQEAHLWMDVDPTDVPCTISLLNRDTERNVNRDWLLAHLRQTSPSTSASSGLGDVGKNAQGDVEPLSDMRVDGNARQSSPGPSPRLILDSTEAETLSDRGSVRMDVDSTSCKWLLAYWIIPGLSLQLPLWNLRLSLRSSSLRIPQTNHIWAWTWTITWHRQRWLKKGKILRKMASNHKVSKCSTFFWVCYLLPCPESPERTKPLMKKRTRQQLTEEDDNESGDELAKSKHSMHSRIPGAQTWCVQSNCPENGPM